MQGEGQLRTLTVTALPTLQEFSKLFKHALQCTVLLTVAGQLLASASRGLTSSSVSGTDASDHVSCRQGELQSGWLYVGSVAAFLTVNGCSPSVQHALRSGPACCRGARATQVLAALNWVRHTPWLHTVLSRKDADLCFFDACTDKGAVSVAWSAHTWWHALSPGGTCAWPGAA